MELCRKKIWFADGILLLVAAIWGGGFVAGKEALSGFSAVNILMYRFAGAALILGILFWKRVIHANRTVIIMGLSIGILQFVGLLIQLIGLQHTTPAKQSFLVAAYVVFTPFVSHFVLKSSLVKRDIWVALLAFVGLALICFSGNAQVGVLQLGDLLSILFAVIFSLQIVLIGRFSGSHMDVFAFTFYQFVSAAILSFVASLVFGIQFSAPPASSIAGIVYLAVINTALAMCLQNYAQRFTNDSHVALLLSLESVFGLVLSTFFYHDPITLPMFLGCAIVLSAVLLSKLHGKHRQS